MRWLTFKEDNLSIFLIKNLVRFTFDHTLQKFYIHLTIGSIEINYADVICRERLIIFRSETSMYGLVCVKRNEYRYLKDISSLHRIRIHYTCYNALSNWILKLNNTNNIDITL